MTLTDNGSNGELTAQDVASRKQQELGKQIKDIAKNDEFNDVFDAGW
jgi:hypothetical protein